METIGLLIAIVAVGYVAYRYTPLGSLLRRLVGYKE